MCYSHFQHNKIFVYILAQLWLPFPFTLHSLTCILSRWAQDVWVTVGVQCVLVWMLHRWACKHALRVGDVEKVGRDMPYEFGYERPCSRHREKDPWNPLLSECMVGSYWEVERIKKKKNPTCSWVSSQSWLIASAIQWKTSAVHTHQGIHTTFYCWAYSQGYVIASLAGAVVVL